MDTFLLNPGPAITQGTTVANASAHTQETSGKEFSPALDNAITNLNQEAQPTASNADAGETTTVNVMAAENLSTADLATTYLATDNLVSAENILSAEIVGSLNTFIENASPQTQDSSKAIISTTENEPTIFLSDVTVLVPEDSTATKVPAKAETILLQQIQQILDEGKDKGTIVIKASTEGATPQKENVTPLNALSSPVLADAPGNATIQAKQNIAQVIMPEEHSKTVSGATNTRSESTRQDVTEQFINAKLSGAEKEKNDTSQQHHDQKGSEGQNKNTLQQTLTTNSPTISTESNLGETTFNQQLGSSSTVVTNPTTTSPLSIEGKFAPGAHIPVAEQEIVDTLIQKFNVNPRLQTSKLTMQLHPAELGSLKIDITVKDGSISAHIITQSHQVLETLDKNMSRLREVLQDQGYQVEDFKITLNTDRGNEQQLFQEQFESKQQDFTASKRTINSETDTFDTLLHEHEEFDALKNKLYSVNLTA